jgi:hypothetical protein
MSTVISARTARAAGAARANEHRYFLGAAVLLTFLVLWAFGFEYRDLMHPSQFTVLVRVHGLVMFAWVGLFLTQVALIVWHRPQWHRRLGVIGMGVALLVVGLGIPTSIVACRLGGDHLPPGVPPPAFLALARLVGFLHLGIGVTPLRNLLLLAFILIDTIRTRRLHPALVAGGACLIAADALANALAGTAVWSGIVQALTA